MKIPRNIKSLNKAFIRKNLAKSIRKGKEMAGIKVEMKHLNPYDREIKKLMRGKTGRIIILKNEENEKGE